MPEGQSNDGVPVSIGAAVLAVVMIAGACFVVGLGLGLVYSFGYNIASIEHSTRVCDTLVKDRDSELSTLKTNFEQLKFKTERYETFLLKTGAQREEAMASGAKKGIGGGP